MKFFYKYFLIFSILLYSCSKNGSTSLEPIDKDIYVCGSELNSTDKYVAKYWKNGSETILSDGKNNAFARSIKVVGNDVFIAGEESNGKNATAKYWKNGQSINLTDGKFYSSANKLAILNSDVYVVGLERNGVNGVIDVAKYWKNGIPFELGDGKINSYAFDVKIIGNDIYILGLDGTEIVYWKNDIRTKILDAPISRIATKSFSIEGIDIYVAGYEVYQNGYFAKYWKNSISTSLTDEKYYSEVFDIKIKDNNVYTVGYQFDGNKNIPKYWKNGVLTLLTVKNNNSSMANSIETSENDIYICGIERVGLNNIIKVWKNGIESNLTDGKYDAMSFSIFVK